MTRHQYRLTARAVASTNEPGRYADGAGLYLLVRPDGKRWLFMPTWAGKRIELGLGSSSAVSLAQARAKAQLLRDKMAAGIDPRLKEAPTVEVRPPTFGDAADDYIAAHEAGWRNDKHIEQWRYTLSRRRNEAGELDREGYCQTLSDILVANVGTEDVLRVLKPIWTAKPETAVRVRGRIEMVLSAAKAKGYRSGENPATWRGHLDNLLPKRRKLTRGHHAAMPFDQVPALFQTLAATNVISNLALAFTIATAARSGETMGATWEEIDFPAEAWRVPASRMKGGRDHVVPLSATALAILESVGRQKRAGNPYVFPGAASGKFSVMALAMALRRAGAGDFTTHGMRSAFRDWCGDKTTFQRDDVELCLAHSIRDETERAYRRSDAFDKRRVIMDAWATFIELKVKT